jgi:hypothetical protein
VNIHPFRPPEKYVYETIPIGSREVVVAKENEGMLGIVSAPELAIPMLPERWKSALHQLRIQRAQVRAASKADRWKRNASMPWKLLNFK